MLNELCWRRNFTDMIFNFTVTQSKVMCSHKRRRDTVLTRLRRRWEDSTTVWRGASVLAVRGYLWLHHTKIKQTVFTLVSFNYRNTKHCTKIAVCYMKICQVPVLTTAHLFTATKMTGLGKLLVHINSCPSIWQSFHVLSGPLDMHLSLCYVIQTARTQKWAMLAWLLLRSVPLHVKSAWGLHACWQM
jgi:hypothetical protein